MYGRRHIAARSPIGHWYDIWHSIGRRSMRIDKDSRKEKANIAKHGLDFSFATLVFADPMAVTVYDRFTDGEHRWHIFAPVGGKLLLVVHSFPDPDDEGWVRVIGLREATAQERRRYEEGGFA